MQGNDWYYVGGAAIGGALLGALGQHLAEGKSTAGKVLVIGRSYARGGKGRVDVDITADFEKGGYTVEIEDPEPPYESHTFDKVFETPEDAAQAVDEFMEVTTFKPEDSWATYLELDLEDQEGPNKPLDLTRLSGRRHR